MSWDPFKDLEKMRKRMEEIFNNLEGYGQRKKPVKRGERQKRAPFTDVQERDDQVVITADLPGVNKEDISIKLQEETLVVSAERKSEETEEKEGFVRRERSSGKFYRQIKLPSDVNKEEAEATFQNGVLEITLPKEEKEEKEKQIEIK